MTDLAPRITDDVTAANRLELRERLFAAGRLIPTGTDGLYGRDATTEAVIDAVRRMVSRVGAPDQPREVHFPPLIPKATFDRIGYLRNFPQLVGPVFSFTGEGADHRRLVARLDDGDPYDDLLTQTDVALTPACCYPVYPSLAGVLGADGATLELVGTCFRHEPSTDPMRLQSFRQHEHVHVGAPDSVDAFRTRWFERAPDVLDRLGLDPITDVATDPFFGRSGRLMQASQREQALKHEVLVDVCGDGNLTACSSINHHQGRFGHLFEITTPDGDDAHSSCVGFGLERIAVALFARHGIDPNAWSPTLRSTLDW